jgi:glycosyltransferase involved in cell wall biosynthesis
MNRPEHNRGSLTVALVSTQESWHGGEEQARLLAVGLRGAGHRCAILARRGGAFVRRMIESGFEVLEFAANGRSPWALWQIRRRLRRIRPDVLHYNDSHAITSAGLASLGEKIPARIAARRVIFDVRRPIRYRMLCDRVICVSRPAADVCLRCGIPRRMLRVVHDGVDPARIASGCRGRGRRALEAADDDKLLVCVAQLGDPKGHAFLLDAMPAVLQQEPQAVLILAGDGELRGELEGRARRLGIERHVRFLGYRHDVPDLIHAADLFVFPSHMEGMGSTLIDVMLAGIPIVTTTAGGIPDITGSDDPRVEPTAWAVPPRSPPALAAAILEALASPERRALHADRARRRALALFTADRMVEATLGVYRETLDPSLPQSP